MAVLLQIMDNCSFVSYCGDGAAVFTGSLLPLSGEGKRKSDLKKLVLKNSLLVRRDQLAAHLNAVEDIVQLILLLVHGTFTLCWTTAIVFKKGPLSLHVYCMSIASMWQL